MDRSREVRDLVNLIERTVEDSGRDYFESLKTRIKQQLLSTPGLIEEMLRNSSVLSTRVEKELFNLVLAELVVDNENTAKKIESLLVNLITTGANKDDDVFLLLNKIGLSSSKTRLELLKYLPYLETSTQLRTAIDSINRFSESQTEKDIVISMVAPYVHHADSAVRTSAILSVGRWGEGKASETILAIEQALNDSSEDVRRAAITSSAMSRAKSPIITLELLNVLSDANEVIDVRVQAHSALKGHKLQEQQLEIYEKYGGIVWTLYQSELSTATGRIPNIEVN